MSMKAHVKYDNRLKFKIQLLIYDKKWGPLTGRALRRVKKIGKTSATRVVLPDRGRRLLFFVFFFREGIPLLERWRLLSFLPAENRTTFVNSNYNKKEYTRKKPNSLLLPHS